MRGKIVWQCALVATTFVALPARGGGLFLPGSGAVSTARAGAAVASSDDGEALSTDPAGLASAPGTEITLSAAFIAYAMRFQRTGSYASVPGEDLPYAGQPYPWVTNNPKLPAAIGPFQPIPVFTVSSDLGGLIPGLVVAVGLYSQNTYPFRDMTDGYQFNGDPSVAPPPTRYDVMKSSGFLAFPSIAAAYRVLPELDVGLRASWGYAHIQTEAALWGYPGNYVEAVSRDAIASGDVRDSFIPTGGAGARYRPRPDIELGAVFNLSAPIHASGTGTFELGPNVGLEGEQLLIGPSPPGASLCKPGQMGTFQRLNSCVDYELPANAALGARYKFLDRHGRMRGDLELDVTWENWGKRCSDIDFSHGCTSPSQIRIVVDGAGYLPDQNGVPQVALDAKPVIVDHEFVDVYSARLGGSYVIPLDTGARRLIVRGGVSLESRAAKDGWLRSDIDGAGHFMAALGAGYHASRYEISVGGALIVPTSNTNPGDCTPLPTATNSMPGCGPNGEQEPVGDRRGPDPINPLVVPSQQSQDPITQGRFEAHYTMFMLGVSTWF